MSLSLSPMMTTISDSGEQIEQEPHILEKTLISQDEYAEDLLKIIYSVGEISLMKEVSSSPFTSISEKDIEQIHSASVEVSTSETEVMNVDCLGVLSLPQTSSRVLEDDKIGGELQLIKEIYTANVSLSEIPKEGDRFGDDVYIIEEVNDTDRAIVSISEVQGFEQEKFVSDSKESSKLEKNEDFDARRLLKAEKRRFRRDVEVGTMFRKRVDMKNLAGAHEIEKNGDFSKEKHKKMERVGVKDNAFVGRSVKLEMIDDTALVDVVSFYKKAKDHPKRPVNARTEKDAPRKHKKIEEKPIDKGNASNVVEKNASTEVCDDGGSNGKQLRITHSSKQMESMRYANMANQKELWSYVYARLLPEVVTEYEGLVSLKNQKRPNLRESGIGTLGPISAVPRRNRVNVFVH